MKPLSVIDAKPGSQLAKYEGEAEQLITSLKPASWDEAQIAVAPLFTMPMGEGINDDAILGAYRMALHGEPIFAIKEAVGRFISGRVEGQSRFCPGSVELAQEVRRIADGTRKRLSQAKGYAEHFRQIASEPANAPISDKTREMVQEAMERMRLAADDERQTLSRKVGPDLSPYYKHRPEPPRKSLPLTAADLKDVPDAPKRKPSFRPAGAYLPFGSKS